jgi:outer membrane immunogenic protein
MDKKIFSAALVAISLSASSAFAADIAPVYKAPPVVAPSYNWTGFYLGGHVGYGWGETAFAPTGIVGLIADPFTMDTDGWFGGLTVGYNYQIQRLVIGVEGEWSWSGIKGAQDTRFLLGLAPLIPGGARAGGTFSNNWMATATTRVGVTFDNVLLYSKFGLAWANNDYNLNDSIPIIAGIPVVGALGRYNSTITETELGWIVGAGVEWGFGGGWSAKIEGTYASFGQKSRQFADIPLPVIPGVGLALPINADIDSNIATVKFGVNYRFDYGKSPVVAKY